MKVDRAASALLLLTIAIAASAQTPPRSQVTGTVTSVSADAKKIAVKSDKGEELSVTVTDKTRILAMPEGETDTKKATPIALSTLGVGDRALVIGPAPADPKVWTATTLLVMSKSGVASLQQKDQDDWKKRGTTGTVTALDAAAKTATIKVGQRTLTVQPSEKTAILHYSLDSARFNDAKPGTFAEIKVGDQMRVLGNKTEDGATILAEKILSGTFRQLAATITSINAQTGEILVKDLATKKPLTIKVETDSTMRKLSDTMAAMLARRYNPSGQQGAGGGAGSGRGTGGPPAGAGGGAGAGSGAGGGAGRGPGGPGGMGGPGGGGRGGDVNQMLDSLPAVQLSDLKPGDAIMVSTTQGSDPNRVTAIMLLAGVEPLLTASPTAARDIMSGWNLGGGGGDTGGQ
jgi:Domain of unknown function (DUF5666)